MQRFGWCDRQDWVKAPQILRVIPGDGRIEAMWHARWRHLRIGRTEWFRAEPELLAAIDAAR